MNKFFITLLSGLIPSSKLRKKFRNSFSNTTIDKGKNNRLIILNDDGTESKCKRIKNFKVIFNGDNNIVKVYKSTNFIEYLELILENNNTFSFGKTKGPIIISILGPCHSCNFDMDNDCSMFGVNVFFRGEAGFNVKIGKDCMFSSNINIRPSDGHTIYDPVTNEILNLPQKIVISDHCWIGMNSTILKGAYVPKDSVIGAGAIYTAKSFKKEHNITGCVFAGNPAKVIKKGINWMRRNTDEFRNTIQKNNNGAMS